MNILKRAGLGLTLLLWLQWPALAEERVYSFNVLNHRSIALTAQYWNPILLYVSEKSGVPLELKLNKTSQENTAKAETGIYDFVFTNHFFTPERERLGYRVIARPTGPGIRGQIIVLRDSPVKDLHDLDGKEVAFPTPDGFTGYWVPMDALLNAGVHVKPVFSGNPENSIGTLTREEVAAAGVNNTVLDHFSRRTGLVYRVLWSSRLYNDLCIMVNPKTSKAKADAVKAALVGMAKDPAGRKILEAGAELLKLDGELGFVASDNHDYESYRTFYKQTHVKP
ncbi:MAG: phosphate/phosphite/phosphonate ABC transporter substrate-binding protein [Burkholderiales bacterium]